MEILLLIGAVTIAVWLYREGKRAGSHGGFRAGRRRGGWR